MITVNIMKLLILKSKPEIMVKKSELYVIKESFMSDQILIIMKNFKKISCSDKEKNNKDKEETSPLFPFSLTVDKKPKHKLQSKTTTSTKVILKRLKKEREKKRREKLLILQERKINKSMKNSRK